METARLNTESRAYKFRIRTTAFPGRHTPQCLDDFSYLVGGHSCARSFAIRRPFHRRFRRLQGVIGGNFGRTLFWRRSWPCARKSAAVRLGFPLRLGRTTDSEISGVLPCREFVRGSAPRSLLLEVRAVWLRTGWFRSKRAACARYPICGPLPSQYRPNRA